MKKILICLILAIILTNCEVRVKQAQAQVTPHWTELSYYSNQQNASGYGTEFKRIVIDSMEYALFTSVGTYNHGTPFLVNLTKDKLEIELLKKQLK